VRRRSADASLRKFYLPEVFRPRTSEAVIPLTCSTLILLLTRLYCEPMVSKVVHDTLAAFVAERDWAQFHTPENLAKSVAIEAGELLECFQWGAEADPKRVREELADVLTYCLLLADRIGADPEQIVLEKLEITRKKYPVDKARGSSSKYDEL
jgi:NTP pyrophosphatase (non-canonical NTP hydrolase)